MKTIILAGLIACSAIAFAQTKVEKSFSTSAVKQLELTFDFPELIRVRSWDKSEVSIRASISINGGESDEAFEIASSNQDGKLTISSRVKDLEKIPHRITFRKDNQDVVFPTGDKNDPRVAKFLEENGSTYSYMSTGVDIRITVDVLIPSGMKTKIFSKFGMVEIHDCRAPLQIDAPHGGVDATIQSSVTGALVARTQFGEILTNLESKFTPMNEGRNRPEHWTEVVTTLGGSNAYQIESRFGKIYLRKP